MDENNLSNKLKVNLEDYLGQVRHNLYSPLHNLLNSFELLKDQHKNQHEDMDELTKKIFGLAQNSLDKMEMNFDKVLASIEVIGNDYHVEKFCPNDHIRSILNSYQEIFDKKKIKLTYDLSDRNQIIISKSQFNYLITAYVEHFLQKYGQYFDHIEVDSAFVNNDEFLFNMRILSTESRDEVPEESNESKLARSKKSIEYMVCKHIIDFNDGEMKLPSSLDKTDRLFFKIKLKHQEAEDKIKNA